MIQHKLRGTGVALVTPFLDNGEVDYPALANLVEYQISNGVNYLVVLGTTGETATLNQEEKKAIVDCVIETNHQRVPIVVGFGGNNTQSIIEQISNFHATDKVDAILSVAPYYNKPTQEGIFQHYKAIANGSPLPVILYNVPGRTGVNISAETSLRLAREIENIVAIKEASGNMEQIMQILKDKPEDFLLISGDDALTYPMIQLGACGVISVIGNAYPKQFSKMVADALQGNNAAALKMHYQLLDLIKNIFVEGNPAGVKALLHQKELLLNNLRLPLVTVSAQHYKKLVNLQKGLQ